MNNTAAQTPAARTQRFSSKSLSMGSLGTDQARYVIRSISGLMPGLPCRCRS